jgi:hypothetical protein
LPERDERFRFSDLEERHPDQANAECPRLLSAPDPTVALMWCAVLIVLGVLFEVTGLGLVAWQLWRVQRREFGLPAWVVTVRARLRRLFRRKVPTTVVSPSPIEHDRAIGGAVVMGRQPPGETVESRLHALEENFAALDRETHARFQRQEKEQADLERLVTETRAELERQQQEREGEEREQLREEMTLQWWGTGLFFLGAVLAGVANGVC